MGRFSVALAVGGRSRLRLVGRTVHALAPTIAAALDRGGFTHLLSRYIVYTIRDGRGSAGRLMAQWSRNARKSAITELHYLVGSGCQAK